MGSVRMECHGCVAQVILSRPDRINAITGDMLVGLVDAWRDFVGQVDCSAVVLSGEGRCFCWSIDLADGGGGGADRVFRQGQTARSGRGWHRRAHTRFSGQHHLIGKPD